jgi:hypothetical protein
MMTRQDYIKFAALLSGEATLAKHNGDHRTEQVVNNIKLGMADIFAHDNPQFDRSRFYAACEPKSKVGDDHV